MQFEPTFYETYLYKTHDILIAWRQDPHRTSVHLYVRRIVARVFCELFSVQDIRGVASRFLFLSIPILHHVSGAAMSLMLSEVQEQRLKNLFSGATT